MRNQKGITLIALVITIIVLLILAGVSIAMLTGNNGILTQAGNAKTQTAEAEVREKINMTLNAEYTNLLADGVLSGETLSGSTLTATTAANIQSANGLDSTYKVTVRATATDATVISIEKAGKTGSITYASGKYTINKAQ